ncbi:2-octaprenyl-6-methoxyphenyl hydroxylase [Gemmobacter lanyuensis]|uniref:2-octaprenyl-6-methoxyphenyl hydroxylase n=1 Tax=Gemmobacter lanyuensis TaxID=1054497 RepID=A0A918MHN9_9RHOB|nr:UbiH/UbiF family hydroxylase [Gemmobacter lanyuensis]GGW23106.1 2-octaprenyl-6-methoxyphenyl hydroxylase [Gemmobacter lanyuensis]
MRETTDILISGGGVAGLAAACAFGAAGFRVICVEPNPPVTKGEAEGSDLRTTAFLHPSIPVLDRAGLWARLAPHAAALQVMRIVDAGGVVPEPRVIKDFDAADLSDKPFGWNLPNWLLRREMLARMAELETVTFLPGLATAAVTTRESEALVTLSDGRRFAARLLIGADGRGSTVRQALGIGVRTLRYGQKALAFAVRHTIPHGNISTEIHRSGGPFTFVPLPDQHGQPCSAVVWMDHAAEIDRRMALPPEAFREEMMTRSCGLLGELTQISRLTAWPIIAQIAAQMSGERTALMAEAAHVMPPIGAQGLNMSLADLTVLLDLAESHRADPGTAAVLDAYHRARHLDVQTRVMGIDLLNRASQIGAQPLRDLRAATLDAMYSIAPVRKTLMRAGIGVR